MNDADLRIAVEKAVRATLDAREGFTAIDISQPLIKADSSIRHYQVCKVIGEMEQHGDWAAAQFAASMVELSQNGPGEAAKARHPTEVKLAQGQPSWRTMKC